MPFKHLLVLGVKMLFLRLLNIYISALKQSFFKDFMVKIFE